MWFGIVAAAPSVLVSVLSVVGGAVETAQKAPAPVRLPHSLRSSPRCARLRCLLRDAPAPGQRETLRVSLAHGGGAAVNGPFQSRPPRPPPRASPASSFGRCAPSLVHGKTVAHSVRAATSLLSLALLVRTSRVARAPCGRKRPVAYCEVGEQRGAPRAPVGGGEAADQRTDRATHATGRGGVGNTRGPGGLRKSLRDFRGVARTRKVLAACQSEALTTAGTAEPFRQTRRARRARSAANDASTAGSGATEERPQNRQRRFWDLRNLSGS